MSLLEKHKCTCDECRIGSKESNPTGYGKETIFRLLNKTRKVVDKYIVDDCLLKEYKRSEKCDYLFNVEELNTTFLVECKGADILKAVSQLESSLDILKESLKGKKIKARIVSTKVYSPDMRNRSYSRLRERLIGELVTQNKLLEEII